MSSTTIGKKGKTSFSNTYGKQRLSGYCFDGASGYWEENGIPKGCIGTSVLQDLLMYTRPYQYDCATKGTVELPLTASTLLYYISKGWLYGPGIDPKKRPEIPDNIRKSWDILIEGNFPNASGHLRWVREVRLAARMLKALWVMELMARTIEKGGLTIPGNPTFTLCKKLSKKQLKLYPITTAPHAFEQVLWLLDYFEGNSALAKRLLQKSFYIPLWSPDRNKDGFVAADSGTQSVKAKDALMPCKTLPFVWAYPCNKRWYLDYFCLTNAQSFPSALGTDSFRQNGDEFECAEFEAISVDTVDEILPRLCMEYDNVSKGKHSILFPPETIKNAWAVHFHKMDPAQAASELRDAIISYEVFVGYAEKKWPDRRARRMIYNIKSALHPRDY